MNTKEDIRRKGENVMVINIKQEWIRIQRKKGVKKDVMKPKE